MIAPFMALLSDSKPFLVDSLEIFFKDGRGLRLLKLVQSVRSLVERIFSPQRRSIHGLLSGWSLALIGNASGRTGGKGEDCVRGVFDKETRRKPLARWTRAYGI